MFQHIYSQSAGIWLHMAAGTVAVIVIRAARIMAACLNLPSADACETSLNLSLGVQSACG